MTPLQMIQEWRKGCSCAEKGHPEQCQECTVALIDAIERSLLASAAEAERANLARLEAGSGAVAD